MAKDPFCLISNLNNYWIHLLTCYEDDRVPLLVLYSINIFCPCVLEACKPNPTHIIKKKIDLQDPYLTRPEPNPPPPNQTFSKMKEDTNKIYTCLYEFIRINQNRLQIISVCWLYLLALPLHGDICPFWDLRPSGQQGGRRSQGQDIFFRRFF
jgi:hypothetical protein